MDALLLLTTGVYTHQKPKVWCMHKRNTRIIVFFYVSLLHYKHMSSIKFSVRNICPISEFRQVKIPIMLKIFLSLDLDHSCYGSLFVAAQFDNATDNPIDSSIIVFPCQPCQSSSMPRHLRHLCTQGSFSV